MNEQNLKNLVAHYKSNPKGYAEPFYAALHALGMQCYESSFRYFDPHDAKDVIQEKIIKLMMKPELIKLDKCVTAFVLVCFRNAFRSWTRTQWRTMSIHERFPEDMTYAGDVWDYLHVAGQELADTPLLCKELQTVIEKYHWHLGTQQRLVIRYRLLEGYTRREVLRLTGLSESQVDTAYCLGLRNLRKHIRRSDPGFLRQE